MPRPAITGHAVAGDHDEQPARQKSLQPLASTASAPLWRSRVCAWTSSRVGGLCVCMDIVACARSLCVGGLRVCTGSMCARPAHAGRVMLKPSGAAVPCWWRVACGRGACGRVACGRGAWGRAGVGRGRSSHPTGCPCRAASRAITRNISRYRTCGIGAQGLVRGV